MQNSCIRAFRQAALLVSASAAPLLLANTAKAATIVACIGEQTTKTTDGGVNRRQALAGPARRAARKHVSGRQRRDDERQHGDERELRHGGEQGSRPWHRRHRSVSRRAERPLAECRRVASPRAESAAEAATPRWPAAAVAARRRQPAAPAPQASGTAAPTSSASSNDSGGCSFQGSGSKSAGAAWLALLGALLVQRRRRPFNG